MSDLSRFQYKKPYSNIYWLVSILHSFNLDCTWSETGDRYMLKLFRDFLFHSVTEDGRPWLDHAHIVQCLNKLDAGSIERVSEPA